MNNILNKLTDEYFEDVLVRMAYNSSAIEGNTITLPETATIIIDQTLPDNSKITNREYFEVLNHQPAFEYMMNNLQNDIPLSIPVIQEIHKILTDRLQHDGGKFKVISNYVSGTEFQTTPPEHVLEVMNQLIENLFYRLEHAKNQEEVIKIILESHVTFEKIHPFSDGNGRSGRMIMNYSLLENDIPMLVIKNEDKNIYKNILHEAQIKDYPEEKDIQRFYDFALPIMEEELKRVNSFYEKKRQERDFDDFER